VTAGGCALWESGAERYDAGYDSSGRAGRVVRARQEAALRLLGAGPGRVLDVGMGGGRLCAALAAAGWEASGVDPSETMVALARSRLAGADERLVVGRAEALPFAAASFDAVAALGSLEYADLAEALGEIARVLRPGGRAVLSWPNFAGLYPLWRRFGLYPPLRLAKRILPLGRPVPPRPRDPRGLAGFLSECDAVKLAIAPAAFLDPRGRTVGASVGALLASQVVCSGSRRV
jgi:SAM-dependent methyltransferase